MPSAPSKMTSGRAMRRLMSLARPEWPMLALATFFLAVGSSTSLIYPTAFGRVIDETLRKNGTGVVDRWALVMLAVFAIQGLAVAMRYVFFTNVGERVVARLRGQLFRALMSQDVAFFDERKTGELTNRLSADTQVLQGTVSGNISQGLRNGATVVGGLVLLTLTSAKLTLLMLVVVPPVAIGAMVYGRKVRKLSREVQDSLAQAGEVAEETLSGLRTVRSFVAEEAEVTRYEDAVQRSYRISRRRSIFAGIFMGGASTAGYAAAAIVFWFGGRMVAHGQLSVGQLSSFLMYTLLVAFSLAGLSDLWADFMRAAGAGERVFELIDRTPVMPLRGGATLPSARGEVRFEKVAFAYPTRRDVPVLKDVDFSLRSGEVVALVGPSGSGKSTVASLLGRLYDPDAGRVLLDGHDVRTLDPGWLRQQVGVVAQEPILFSTSIGENIRYARRAASPEDVQRAAVTANAHAFIEQFPQRYDTLVGERGIQLSGGQKQRVAIARALLKDPRILVLDEATSALDAESEHLVREALERLMKGRTTLIIAHRLSTVMGADRVLVLENGNIIQSGSHASLMRQEGLYRRLVERQFVAA